ncbi:MAG: hypothetical protein A3E83_04460 [Gammaproteobacteria bacterium RIFCSPHIGHO2_12_FULL_41_20]|nr:MAG: hypothetical protein A3E83_04460 [Gammaproteobacteria bacterium RIFCSPHIGHO2_12_FULL_41_20]
MPKKKSLKRPSKHHTQPPTTLIEKIEKAFWNVPAQLAAQCTKDLGNLKQQAVRLKANIQKSKDVLKTHQARIAAAMKLKPSPAKKNKLTAAKKAHQHTQKNLLAFIKTAEEAQVHYKNLIEKQAKFTALRKALEQFSRDWSKKKPVSKKTVSPVKKPTNKPTNITVATFPKTQTETTSTLATTDIKKEKSTELTS